MTVSNINRAVYRAVLSLVFLAAFCGATRCGAQASRMMIFDTNGEFMVPAGVSNIIVEVWGGGGGGGNAYTNVVVASGVEGQVSLATQEYGAGGGGGGGAYGKTNLTVTPGRSFAVTVGEGGNSETSHSMNGTPSSFGFAITANGGANGGNGSNAVSGAGGPGGAATGVTDASAQTNLIVTNSITLGAIATGVTPPGTQRGIYSASITLGGLFTGTTAVSGQSGTYSANDTEGFGGNGGVSPSGGLGGRGAKAVNGVNSGEAGQVPGGGGGGGGVVYLSSGKYETVPPGLGGHGRVIVYY